MATLCLLLASCSQNEMDFNDSDSLQIESRSFLPISCTYMTESGEYTSVNCGGVTISYLDNTQASISIIDGSGNNTVTYGHDISILVEEGYELGIQVDSTYNYTSDDLFIDPCDTHLCYLNSLNLNGKGLNFIIEDLPAGL